MATGVEVSPALTPDERAAILVGLPSTARPALQPLDDGRLVATLMAHARAVTGQRIVPPEVDAYWAYRPERRDITTEFANARADGALTAWVSGLAPVDPRYRALAEARCRFEQTTRSRSAPQIPAGSVLREGQVDARVPVLREALAALGEPVPAPSAANPMLFDLLLAETVRAAQRRFGVAADGLVGPATRAALNAGPGLLAARADATLERWHWLPRTLPPRRIEVDVAAATLTQFEDGAHRRTRRVVVGAPSTRTPLFATSINSIVLNPPWNVPDSIARNEIVPKLVNDPLYLFRNNISVVDGRFVQAPGPDSALGVVKFDFPNPFSVYLHDTPSKAAFARERRTLSHGCVRVEDPRSLALALLEGQGWTRERLEKAIADGTTQRVPVSSPMPLFIVYHTATVDAEGRLVALADPYGWDARLNAALQAATEATVAFESGVSECASAQP